jgi:NitT/TauT family transport system permease protein
MAVDATRLDAEFAGLDALEAQALPVPAGPRAWARRAWSAVWPKLAAAFILVGVWHAVVWAELKPPWVLPGPAAVFDELQALVGKGSFWTAIGVTMRRAAVGYALAVVIGVVIGVLVARFKLLRTAVGSLITGLQTMPSIAWFPLTILLFGLQESAILFVVVLGAAPSIANGLLTGVDSVPPALVRCGRVLGAGSVDMYRFVILPASLPAFIGGLKQGWAFAWRSLMAGEILVIIASRPSLGANLQFARELSDARGLLAFMVVVLIVGILVDSVFGRAERAVRRRWGLVDAAEAA